MNEVKQRQIGIWTAAAVSAPLAHNSGCGWLAAAVAAVLLLPLAGLAGDGWEKLGKWTARLEFLWLSVMTGVLLRDSGAYWESTGSWLVPLVILVLAAQTQPGAAPRAGAVVGLILVVMYLPVAVSGAVHVRWEWLKPGWELPQPELLAALLLPALAGAAYRPGTGTAVGTQAVGFAALTQGLVYVWVETPFFEVARTIPRLEAVCTVAVTLGWYAMASFLLSTAAKLTGKEKIGKWMGALIAAVSMELPVGFLMVPVTIIMWVLIPFLHRKRNVEIRENNA